MRYSLKVASLVCALTLTAEPSIAMNNDIIIFEASCQNKSVCIFNGQDIDVTISLKNVSNSSVDYPLEYIKSSGPSIRLIDKLTGASRPLRTRLTDPSLMDKLSSIKPGQRVAFNTVIKPAEITLFRLDYIDLTAEFLISTTMRLNSDKEAPYKGTTALRIVGTDTYEREQSSR